jgi:hypothetical protein
MWNDEQTVLPWVDGHSSKWEGTMPRFYFDVREGTRFVPDEVGLTYDNLDAERAAAEIGRELLPKGDAREITVEVRNEYRQRMLTVTASLEIHRVDPEPLPPRW